MDIPTLTFHVLALWIHGPQAFGYVYTKLRHGPPSDIRLLRAHPWDNESPMPLASWRYISGPVVHFVLVRRSSRRRLRFSVLMYKHSSQPARQIVQQAIKCTSEKSFALDERRVNFGLGMKNGNRSHHVASGTGVVLLFLGLRCIFGSTNTTNCTTDVSVYGRDIF